MQHSLQQPNNRCHLNQRTRKHLKASSKVLLDMKKLGWLGIARLADRRSCLWNLLAIITDPKLYGAITIKESGNKLADMLQDAWGLH